MANEVSNCEMWKGAIRKEQRMAKAAKEEWGFLTVHEPSPPMEFTTQAIKYTGQRGGTTIINKRIPLLPSDKRALAANPSRDLETMLYTMSRNGPGSLDTLIPRPHTAMDSTYYSHATMMHKIRSTDPFLRTTSSVYGSRKPIEQFGVSHHGVRETEVVRKERRDF